MKRFSGLLQFILGFFLGITILVGLTSALGYLMFSRLAATPNKPVFSEENKSKVKATTPDKKASEKSAAKPEVFPSPKAATESPSPEVSPSPSPSPEAKEDLPKGAYKAKVTWSGGLSLRSNPSKESERVSGVDYDQELIILETSADGVWAKVRSVDGGQEGWVKVGNFKKTE
ncbi:MAG: SH3 domain-containing protein [Snowella sp.]|nr:SH3 domain-containing protein [Snowella sp.]